MAKIKAVIFDLNGIFLNGKPLSDRVEEKFEVNKDIFWNAFKTPLDISRKNKNTDSSIWQSVADLLKITPDEFLEFWFSGENIDLEMLKFAKNLKDDGLKIFILSNNLKFRTEYYREHFPELFNTFDKTYFSWETGVAKPDSKSFENILNENNLCPSDCLYLDDSTKNVLAAIDLGIKSRVFEDINQTKKFIEENI
jgi:FMN phosphatase YigB (HAD superfamily)